MSFGQSNPPPGHSANPLARGEQPFVEDFPLPPSSAFSTASTPEQFAEQRRQQDQAEEDAYFDGYDIDRSFPTRDDWYRQREISDQRAHVERLELAVIELQDYMVRMRHSEVERATQRIHEVNERLEHGRRFRDANQRVEPMGRRPERRPRWAQDRVPSPPRPTRHSPPRAPHIRLRPRPAHSAARRNAAQGASHASPFPTHHELERLEEQRLYDEYFAFSGGARENLRGNGQGNRQGSSSRPVAMGQIGRARGSERTGGNAARRSGDDAGAP
ncbi:hypothetical protein CC80DRAFT_499772 [Byssothecium circinans]|uniref:Uncharacterized protein n=1 Tax=Byssothecium circinans TaxID=147558 RepID=A0A6A5UMT7_9PLEO|nr:hypothetical protein CC80DRAFT_499772 [Byssothecium circinans]